MGRSVDYLTRARHVTYFPHPMRENEYGEHTEEPEDWDFVEDYLIERISEAMPSLDVLTRKNKRWDGETSILFDNEYCEIGISEYCGLTSLSIRVNEHPLEYTQTDEEYKLEEAKSEVWIDANWSLIEAAIPYEVYKRIGGFSNGESIYEKKNT